MYSDQCTNVGIVGGRAGPVWAGLTIFSCYIYAWNGPEDIPLTSAPIIIPVPLPSRYTFADTTSTLSGTL